MAYEHLQGLVRETNSNSRLVRVVLNWREAPCIVLDVQALEMKSFLGEKRVAYLVFFIFFGKKMMKTISCWDGSHRFLSSEIESSLPSPNR